MMKRLLVLSALGIGACSNAGSDLGPAPFTEADLAVAVFLDKDGTGALSPPDTVVAGARVFLRPPGGGQVIQTVTTDRLGVAAFENLPSGEYSISVDLGSLGDSVVVADVFPNPVLVRPVEGPVAAAVLLKYPDFAIRRARQEPLGKRILIRGIILAGVQSFRDTTAYVRDTSGQIRLTRVALRGGLTGNTPGDSVTVLGTVSSRAGQPTLDQAIVTLVGTRPPPVPLSISTLTAADAAGGTLDAALVRITGAIISDTATVAPDFRVVGSDGSGPLDVILDAFGGYTRNFFGLGRSMNVSGVLVPDGTGKWQLKPRNPGDAAVF